MHKGEKHAFFFWRLVRNCQYGIYKKGLTEIETCPLCAKLQTALHFSVSHLLLVTQDESVPEAFANNTNMLFSLILTQ